jgi:homoserine kinase
LTQRLTGTEIAVPASIGNLGPGFDTLGLAVSLYLRVRVARVVPDGRGRLVCRFADGVPAAPNLIARAFRVSPSKRIRDSIEVEVRSDIPQRAGLGSSAAATVAGLRLRDALDGTRSLAALAAVACRLDGHPDTAAAALFGGLTSSCVLSDGEVRVVRWTWPPSWRILVVTPGVQLSTRAARGVLPRRVPLEDAVFNLQRIAHLLGAVTRKDPSALGLALEDRCHQRYRQPLVPVLRDALRLRHRDLLGVCLSGAGPSIVAFTNSNVAAVERAVNRLYRKAGVPCTIRRLKVHAAGRVQRRTIPTAGPGGPVDTDRATRD